MFNSLTDDRCMPPMRIVLAAPANLNYFWISVLQIPAHHPMPGAGREKNTIKSPYNRVFCSIDQQFRSHCCVCEKYKSP